jgi:hypothetical protein
MPEVGGMRIMIRQDDEGGMIRAYLGVDEDNAVLIATLSLGLAKECRPAFDVWKEALTRIMVLANEQCGVKVLRTFEERAHEGN